MPHGLKRFQQSAQSHFVTFTCYHRRRGFDAPAVYDLFVRVLEQMRRRFALCVYGYVVMPDHVHLLLSEPQRGLLADAVHHLKLSFAKRLVAQVRAPILGANLGRNLGVPSGVFWQKRYYDRNVRDEHEFVEKLRYIHRNRGPRQTRFWLAGVEAGEGRIMRAPRRLAVEQLSSLCAARKRSRGNRVGVDGAGSGEASDRQRGKDIADPRLAPKYSARTWAPPALSNAKRFSGTAGFILTTLSCPSNE